RAFAQEHGLAPIQGDRESRLQQPGAQLVEPDHGPGRRRFAAPAEERSSTLDRLAGTATLLEQGAPRRQRDDGLGPMLLDGERAAGGLRGLVEGALRWEHEDRERAVRQKFGARAEAGQPGAQGVSERALPERVVRKGLSWTPRWLGPRNREDQ